ncbi:hypothetical protein A9R05_14875 [Burkholderia sp. KK1]|nr:hypothetical protein A9R05_14875 [Burkholderia sp. KK1]
MWASAHKAFVTLFVATWGALLNKVIHRPVESIGNPKIIGGLQTILMFHFNFVSDGPIAVSSARARGPAR